MGTHCALSFCVYRRILLVLPLSQLSGLLLDLGGSLLVELRFLLLLAAFLSQSFQARKLSLSLLLLCSLGVDLRTNMRLLCGLLGQVLAWATSLTSLLFSQKLWALVVVVDVGVLVEKQCTYAFDAAHFTTQTIAFNTIVSST